MTDNKFTRDNPFVFDGITITTWTTESGVKRVTVESDRTVYPMNLTTALAIHAFIAAEQESDYWHYTNADHTEARKGRWGAKCPTGGDWCITHEDFPGAGFWKPHIKPAEILEQVHADFLSWHQAQNQPSEPTGLGAVVEVGGGRWLLDGADDGTGAWWSLNPTGRCRMSWDNLTSRGPVTVLSTGVES